MSTKPCRECETATALGLALYICNDAKLECPKLHSVITKEEINDEELLGALLEMLEESPKDRKYEAEAVVCSAFPSREGCDKLLKEVEG